MKKIILILTLLTLTFNAVSAQTVFGFETAVDNGDNITETLNGITVTLSGDPDLQLFDGSGFGGTTANVALTPNTVTSVTFTFDQPVVVSSIIPIEANGSTVDYTFTPTGGSNEPVTVSLINGTVPTVNLNWVNVTSFTVTASGAAFGFDDLSVDTGTNGQTFFEWETANNAGGTITETVNGIGVTVSGDSSYSLTDYGGAQGTSGNVILSNATRTSITFTFDQPVVVNSILALEGTGADIDYTFTPTGGNNAPVTKSLISGAAAVKLNWANVTSFTVTSSGSAFGFDNLSVTGIMSTTVFGFETSTGYHITDPAQNCEEGQIKWWITETIDGITIDLTSYDCTNVHTQLQQYSSNRTSGIFAAITNDQPDNYPMLVTFSEPVVVNSLIPTLSTQLYIPDTTDYTITPIGGNYSPVTITMIDGLYMNGGAVNLNWVNITAFTIWTPYVGATTPNIGLDDISVNALIPLGVDDNHTSQKATIYPNPVANTLYIKNVTDFKSISLYNVLGQQVLQSKEAIIDMSGLSKGLYLLQIHTGDGTETRKIIKK